MIHGLVDSELHWHIFYKEYIIGVMVQFGKLFACGQPSQDPKLP